MKKKSKSGPNGGMAPDKVWKVVAYSLPLLFAMVAGALIGLVFTGQFGDVGVVRQIDAPGMGGGVVRSDPGLPPLLSNVLPSRMQSHIVRVIEFQPQTLAGLKYAYELPRLEWLDLREIEVQDSMMMELVDVGNIKRIQVRKGQISEQMLNEMDKIRPDLTVQLLD
jgi:hypothetical protein